jgi:hypothetical protein
VLAWLLVGLSLLVGGFLLRELARAAPTARFEAQRPPRAPDYRDGRAWAALPGRADRADLALIAGTRDQQATAQADVFFLHAGANFTSYWNLPIDHWIGRRLVDGGSIAPLASLWNGCCRVYAPRYRQEAILVPEGADRDKALELAYSDVRRAFRYYLARYNQGRPLILAGANSGARHALRLLGDEFAGTPLKSRLVAAYLVSAKVDRAARARLPDIPICDSATQTGCINTWSTVGRQRQAQTVAADDAACVNPLSWRAEGGLVDRELNRGGVRPSLVGTFFDGPPPQAIAHMADAECAHGYLWVTPNPAIADAYQPGGPGDYHSQNLTFFYANVRENALQRVQSFVASVASNAQRCAPGPSARSGLAPAPAVAEAPHAGAGEPCTEVAPTLLPGGGAHDWPGAIPSALRLP